MRRILLASLVCAALAAGGSAFAVETGPAPNTDKTTSAPSTKHTATAKATAKPKKRPVPISAAIETTPSTQLPLGSAPTAPSPSEQHSWTGVYAGGGAGMVAGK